MAFIAGMAVMAFVWWLCSAASDPYEVDEYDEEAERAQYTWKDRDD
jgi:hypothetical protein